MKLFEPITIRGVKFKNRIVMSPMATGLGLRNAAARGYYRERARGGVGTIIVAGVMPDLLVNEKFTRGFYDFVGKPAQEAGARIGPQLWYGNQYPSSWGEGVMPEYVAPSAGVPAGAKHMLRFFQDTQCYCRELTIPEIQDIIATYATAAKTVKDAGFDFVEMHGCHGHILPHQFFSPLDNRRTDRYGGSLANRMRFAVELAGAVRAAVGNDFPFFWRLSAEEGLPGGFTLAECAELAAALEKAGVDVIDVSWGHEVPYEPLPPGPQVFMPGEEREPGTFVPQAETIKKRVTVPVVGVGRIHSPVVAERILAQGRVDMVAIGRQLITDPFWPQKVAEGKPDEIKPCILCNVCVQTLGLRSGGIRCSVNPMVGREEELGEITPTGSKKKVVVVGGGPSGMEAARIVALRGHDVMLCDSKPRLGGTLLLAARPPRKTRISDFTDYMRAQVEKAGVKIELGEEATAEDILAMKPDAVVIATGATPGVPPIPGISSRKVISAEDVLSGKARAGQDVVVIGGGQVGCETAELLAEAGKKVTIIEILDELANVLSNQARHYLLYRLGALGVRMLTGTKCEGITGTGLAICDRRRRSYTIPADTIIIATGYRSNNRLAKELEGKVDCLYSVGDAISPRRIVDAMADGMSVGRSI